VVRYVPKKEKDRESEKVEEQRNKAPTHEWAYFELMGP